MTRKQITRAIYKLWDRLEQRNGYQPYGYDRRTLALTESAWLSSLDRLQTMLRQAPRK